MTILPAHEREQLAAPMRYPEDRALILVTGWCALRIGEVLTLHRRHVTQDRAGRVILQITSQVQVRGRGPYEMAPKSAAGDREVYIPDVVRDALAEHLTAHVGADPDALLVPRRGGGNQLDTRIRSASGSTRGGRPAQR